jgi:hypothetical protein
VTPHYADESVTVHHGDCLDVLRGLPDASVDAVVCDPPYGLGFMGREWDDLPPGEEWARECLRLLKPGGHLLAFGGSRTWHRLACAIEDAGFELRDSIAWLHGQGFPKGKGQLKPAFEPVVVGRKRGPIWLNIDACRVDGEPRSTGTRNPHAISGVNGTYGRDLRTDRQQRYDANKPAGRWPTNVLLGHADGCEQIGTLEVRSNTCPAGAASIYGTEMADRDRTPAGYGREIVPAWQCVPGCPVGELDRQSGTLTSPGSYARSTEVVNNVYGASNARPVQHGHGDSGGASRFFPTFRYEAKAPTAERPKVDGVAHPTVKPVDLMRWLVRLVTPPGGLVLDPFAGSGTTGEACIAEGFRALLIEREATYLPLIVARLSKPIQPDLFGGAA